MKNHSSRAFWHAWLYEIIKGTSENEIKRHIKKHVQELDHANTKNQKREWIASMKNLIYIFEGVEKQDVDVIHMLSRLNEKFLSDPSTYDPPPKAELYYKDKQLVVPSSFEIERGYSLKETLIDIIGRCSTDKNKDRTNSNKSHSSRVSSSSGEKWWS